MYESGENYLETILMLHQKQGYVRSIDIANELGFTKPSVSRAMSILKNDGYIVVESSGNIVLTEKGSKKANEVYERHLYIKMCIRDRCSTVRKRFTNGNVSGQSDRYFTW